jgi:hypothetical protein
VSKNVACISPKVINSARHVWGMVTLIVLRCFAAAACYCLPRRRSSMLVSRTGPSDVACAIPPPPGANAPALTLLVRLCDFRSGFLQLSYLLNTIIFLLSGVIVAEKLFRST